MKLYYADRYGMISSVDVAHALRRAAERKRTEEQEGKERDQRRLARAASRRRMVARVRAVVAPPVGAISGLFSGGRP
ncbi:MAG TPA: hypothetical protein VEG67_09510 [Myxococcota bacterium]|nr:hypothetical protein [Myxococcota bacterium]